MYGCSCIYPILPSKCVGGVPVLRTEQHRPEPQHPRILLMSGPGNGGRYCHMHTIPHTHMALVLGGHDSVTQSNLRCIDELSMVILSKWQFGTSFGASNALTRLGARTLYLYWLCDPINRKVCAPRRVSASGAPQIVTWIKQTWIKHQCTKLT